MKNWPIFCIWIAIAEAVGITAGILIKNDIQIYSSEIIKPLLSPAPILFPIVWTILYALMGYGAAKVFVKTHFHEPKRLIALRLWWIQLFFNFSWCFLFFSFRAFGTAFVWLIILIICVIGMFAAFLKVDKTAAYLQIPYLLWLLFAAYLNYSVWILN